ncbi:ketoacyl-ACP synthase III family protein [Nocardiopsis tropica]|uniref:Ketoacyl-ACP synthase III family protein n=1 Tax=Nocardiopsis tropica TaxID=109330 RepID=A0ABU7KU64_9ACTN|nr:ketoacyl-ACP synthase III family protein [Nocardiopsis umidischolae]MEE2052817.1 ketoacyl-ACP synthase III family protein [Nocardiopsis umidischolae]
MYLPEARTSVEAAVAQGLTSAEEAAVHGMAGAAVAGALPAPEMALRSARDAYVQAGADPDDTRVLLYADTWHQGPDGWFPQYHLQHHLVRGDVIAAEVRQGCNALFTAMELAVPHLRDAPEDATALLVAADNFGTPNIDRWRSGAFVLGDGACAVLLGRRPGPARVLAAGSMVVPELEEHHRAGEPDFPPAATTGTALDFRARARAHAARGEVDPEVNIAWFTLQKKMMLLVGRTLAEAGVGLGEVSRAAFGNLGPDAVEHRWMDVLGLPMEKSTWGHGRTIGHIGAADPFIGLRHLMDTGGARPGDHVLLGGLGSGMTLSCAVVRIADATHGS